MMITGAFGNSYRGPQSASELTLVLDSASMTLVSKASPPWLWGRTQQIESTSQCWEHRFDSCSVKIPHAAEQLSPCTPTTEPEL